MSLATPEPWTLAAGKGRYTKTYIKGAHGAPIATVHAHAKQSMGEFAANVALLQHAQQMAAALKECTDRLEKLAREAGYRVDQQSPIYRYRLLLKKAYIENLEHHI